MRRLLYTTGVVILVLTAAVPALAAQPKTAIDQRAERYRSELHAAFQAANPTSRITSGVYRPPIGPQVAFACNGEDTLAASGVYTLRATSCAEKAASGSNVGAVRGHTKLVCRGSNLALVTCQWITVASNSSQIAPQGCELQREGDTDSWIDVAGNCTGNWHNVQSRDLYTNWSCAYPGVSLDHQMQMSLAWARLPNNVETQPHSHWSTWVVLKTEC
jgi:hypothetical protein